MGKQVRDFTPKNWGNLRAAVKLYDDAADFALDQDNGKFCRRSDGGVNMRTRGIRLTLALVYGDTVSSKYLSNRLGKCKPEQIGGSADPRYTPYQNLVIIAPRMGPEHSRFKGLPAGSEELRIDYVIRPGSNKFCSTFHLVGTSQPGLDRHLCWWDIKGISLADLTISLHSQWLLSKTAEVAVSEVPARTGGVWGTMMRIPPAAEYGEDGTKLVEMRFPVLAASYIQQRNPNTTRFTISINMHNHTFFMNTVLSYIKPDTIAPITRVVFSFQFDTSESAPPHLPFQESPRPSVSLSVPSPGPVTPKNTPLVHATGLPSPDVPHFAGDEKTFVEGLGSTEALDPSPTNLPSSGEPVDPSTRSSTTSAEERMMIDPASGDVSPLTSPNEDVHMSPLSSTSDYSDDSFADYIEYEDSHPSTAFALDSGTRLIDPEAGSSLSPNAGFATNRKDEMRRENLDERCFSALGLNALPLALSIPLTLPRFSVLIPVPYRTWEIGRFQPLPDTPWRVSSPALTLDYPGLFLDTDIWFPPYASSQESVDQRLRDNHGELNFVHQFA